MTTSNTNGQPDLGDWYVGAITEGGVVLTLVGFASQEEPQFTNDESYDGIRFACEQSALAMAIHLGWGHELGVDLIVFQE